MTNQSVSPEKKSPQGRLSNELQNQREGIGIVWYLVLIMYLILIGSTAYITFFDNNGFASHESNINHLKELGPGDELNLFKELVEDEIKSIDAINSLATQSFNVVLGALLGFLSATATMLTGKEQEPQEDPKESEN